MKDVELATILQQLGRLLVDHVSDLVADFLARCDTYELGLLDFRRPVVLRKSPDVVHL